MEGREREWRRRGEGLLPRVCFVKFCPHPLSLRNCLWQCRRCPRRHTRLESVRFHVSDSGIGDPPSPLSPKRDTTRGGKASTTSESLHRFVQLDRLDSTCRRGIERLKSRGGGWSEAKVNRALGERNPVDNHNTRFICLRRLHRETVPPPLPRFSSDSGSKARQIRPGKHKYFGEYNGEVYK